MNAFSKKNVQSLQGGKASKSKHLDTNPLTETQTNEILCQQLFERNSDPQKYSMIGGNLDTHKHTHIPNSSKDTVTLCYLIHGSPLGVVPVGIPLAPAGKQISEGDLTPVQREGDAGKLELETRLEAPRAPSMDVCHQYVASRCTWSGPVINTHRCCSTATKQGQGCVRFMSTTGV